MNRAHEETVRGVGFISVRDQKNKVTMPLIMSGDRGGAAPGDVMILAFQGVSPGIRRPYSLKSRSTSGKITAGVKTGGQWRCGMRRPVAGIGLQRID